MRIAFLGKGGSGKTTFAAAFSKYIAERSPAMLAIDADVNMHLHQSLGMDAPSKTLGDGYAELGEYLFKNRKHAENLPELGVIPPSSDSRFIKEVTDPIVQTFSSTKGSINLLHVGSFQEDEIGAWCFHGRLQGLELFLHYLLTPQSVPVVIDLNAGADAVSSSLYFAADTYIFIVEPTLKSISVYKDYIELVEDSVKKGDIVVKVVVNKLYSEEDKAFVHEHVSPEDIIGYLDYDPVVTDTDTFIEKHSAILEDIERIAAEFQKTPARYLELQIEHFIKKVGEGAEEFIDDSFSHDNVTAPVDEYFERCYLSPITEHKKIMFRAITPNISGDVFEIGAGEMPWYWALGYIHRVNSVVFSEYQEEYLENYQDFMATLDPKNMPETIVDTVEFLKSENLVPADRYAEDIFDEIHKKSTSMQFDFLNPKPIEKEFDTVIGFEALEIVDNEEDFLRVMQTVHGLLKDGGRFVGTTFPYREQSEFVKELINRKLEGHLNPGAELIESTARKAGFTDASIREVEGGKDVYANALVVNLKK